MAKVLVTGAAGFVGFHLCQRLLDAGHQVVGYDGMTAYYDVTLKQRRLEILSGHTGFTSVVGMIEDFDTLRNTCQIHKPTVIAHLAAQAGVRYSFENPRAYIDSNLVGTFNVMECARELAVDHLLMASSSSVYGANTEMPFREDHKTNTPMSLYAATKKANEAMGHSYAHLHKLPTTMFRFFTVYGPWGRPDMAIFKFTKGLLDGDPIDIYNKGEMFRDFTYVTDLVHAIGLLVDVPPAGQDSRVDGDTLSPIAPYRIVNIGNSQQVRLLDFVEALEDATGKTAIRNYLDMQPGDVSGTWADTTLLRNLTGYQPATDIGDGVQQFVDWYRDYYGV